MSSRPPDPLDDISLLQAAAVGRLFGGVSAMWLWRRQKDGTLPPPMIIAGRRFWTVQQITAVIEKIKRTVPTGQSEDHPTDTSCSDALKVPEEGNRPDLRPRRHGGQVRARHAESDAL